MGLKSFLGNVFVAWIESPLTKHNLIGDKGELRQTELDHVRAEFDLNRK